jgi:hypothetical protein
MREAAAAALQAATDAGASHADVRVERLRGQDLSLRNGRLGAPRRPGHRRPRGPGGARRHVGLRQRTRRRRRRGGAPGPPGRRAGPHVPAAELRAGGAGRRAGARRRHLGVGLRGRPLRRRPGRQGGAPVVVERPAPRVGRRRPRRQLALPGARVQVLRRHRRDDDHPAAGAPPARRADHEGRPRGRLRDDAHHGAARGPRVGVRHRRHLGLGGGARAAAVARRREGAGGAASRPAATTS